MTLCYYMGETKLYRCSILNMGQWLGKNNVFYSWLLVPVVQIIDLAGLPLARIIHVEISLVTFYMYLILDFKTLMTDTVLVLV